MSWLTAFFTVCLFTITVAIPEAGLWNLETYLGHEYVLVKKSMFKGTKVMIKVKCDPKEENNDMNITISWLLYKTPCWHEFAIVDPLKQFFENPAVKDGPNHNTGIFKSKEMIRPCDHNIILDFEELKIPEAEKNAEEAKKERDVSNQDVSSNSPVLETSSESPGENRVVNKQDISSGGMAQTNHPVTNIVYDGVYFLVVHTEAVSQINEYTAAINIQMKSDYGYLSAGDWPLLGFYAAMCVVYVLYGLAWLIVSFLRWRELLRVQYWIGAVILLGMLEKAVFTAEYSSVNQQGESIPSLIIFAEIVSCAKRTLARMLVIIVSLGFGIVKPRLGVVLHRVVGVGLIYFILASIEGYIRARQSRSDPQRPVFMASLPLALLESAICFWIFTALLQTTRTLRLRRNLVKLSLYRHFTNTLAFALVASVIFMLWGIRNHRMEECLTDWKELWVDDAYWHILFAIILLVIMILWRPSNNNQRFAFSPLLDDGSDADDEEEGEKLMADISDTMKLRNTRNSTSSSPRESRSVEDDLKWVEENIPSSLTDTALPILDSEEEIMTTRFEASKMQ